MLTEKRPGDLLDLEKVDQVSIHPHHAKVNKPSVLFTETVDVRWVTVLNPALSSNNTVILVLPTKLSKDIVLQLGFNTQPDGLLNVKKPRVTIAPISKTILQMGLSLDSDDVASAVASGNSSFILIDEVQVRVELLQQAWWVRTSWNVLLSFEIADLAKTVPVGPKLLYSSFRRGSVFFDDVASLGNVEGDLDIADDDSQERLVS